MLKALRSHKVYVPLITILGSALLFFFYYLFYVSWQRKDADERAFRFLSVVGGQLTQRFDSVKKVMAAAYVSGEPKPYLEKFLKGQVSNVISMPAHPPWGEIDDKGTLRLRLIDQAEGFSVRIEYRPGGEAAAKPRADFCESTARKTLCADLALDKERIRNETEGYFDNLLIATKTGQIVFQDSTSGMRIDNLSSLFPAKPAPDKKKSEDTKEASSADAGTGRSFAEVSQFSNVVDVNLGGDKYKLYIHPVPIGVHDNNGENIRPVVCGLWRADRLQSEVVSIPYGTLIWTGLMLAAAFAFLWPLLKVAYMSPSERLRRKQIFHLLFSALLVTTLLTLIVLNWSYALRNHEEADEQLTALANAIDRNAKAELVQALTFLNSIGSDERFLHERLRRSESEDWIQNNFLKTYASSFQELQRTSAYYPYFETCFWVRGDGKQQFKITVNSVKTPRTPVTSQEFFQAVLHNNLSSFPEWQDRREYPGDDGKRFRFRFDSLYAPNTGSYFVRIAVPYATPSNWKKDLPPTAQDLKAQVLVTKFLSLQDPVVPQEFGYAVLDQTGQVQFHSSAARNHIENFFDECRRDSALKSLVLQRSEGWLTVNYMGRQRRMLVRPMPYLGEPARSLVVFRDCNHFATIHVACIVVFLLLAGMLAVPALTALAIYVFKRRDYPLAALWPVESDIPKYVEIIVASACLTAAFCLGFPEMTMNETFMAVAVTAGVGVLLLLLRIDWTVGSRVLLARAIVLMAIVGLAFWKQPHGGLAQLAAGICIPISLAAVLKTLHQRAGRWFTLRQLYVAAVFSLLILVVGLPCVGLFRISYNTVNRLALQSAQLARLDQLRHRTECIRTHFRELMDGSSEKLAGDYIDARIEEDLDRYDDPIFNPDPGNQPAMESSEGWEEFDGGLFERWIAKATTLLPANPLGADMREVVLADHERPAWTTKQNGDDQLIRLTGVPEEIVPGGQLAGVYPLWQLPRQAEVLMVLLAVLLLSWLYYLVGKVFMTDLELLRPLENWNAGEAGNLLVIGQPAATLPQAQVLDIVNMATTGSWDDPDTSLSKLRLLERLLYIEKRCVILVSAVDPLFYLISSSPEMAAPSKETNDTPSQLLSRWSNVLSQFEKRQIEEVTEDDWNELIREDRQKAWQSDFARLVTEECRHTAALRQIGLAMLKSRHSRHLVSRSEFVRELIDRADAYYRALWATCTKTERLVLYQLAQDGWANPKNEAALQQLQRRRMIRQESGLRIMNSSFRWFIRSAQCPEEVERWEQQEAQSTWGVAKLALCTAALMFGGWVLYSQRDVFQVGVGYVAALGAASGAIMTLVRNLTGKGSGQAVNG